MNRSWMRQTVNLTSLILFFSTLKWHHASCKCSRTLVKISDNITRIMTVFVVDSMIMGLWCVCCWCCVIVWCVSSCCLFFAEMDIWRIPWNSGLLNWIYWRYRKVFFWKSFITLLILKLYSTSFLFFYEPRLADILNIARCHIKRSMNEIREVKMTVCLIKLLFMPCHWWHLHSKAYLILLSWSKELNTSTMLSRYCWW